MINFYRIVSSNTPKVYVGSTEKDINSRLNQHKNDRKRYQDGRFPKVMSFDILEFKNYSIELIETLECETKDDRDTIERRHILRNLTAVNKQIPGRTDAQYYQDHKQQINERHQQNYRDSKESFNQKHTCRCSGKYTTANKSNHEKTNKHQNYIRNQPVNINGNNNVMHIHNYN